MIKKYCSITVIACFLAVATIYFIGSSAIAETLLKTEPTEAVLDPKSLAAVKIKGTGFNAEDRIMIVLAGADKGKDIAIATADADASGSFETTMNMLSILQGIFHFRYQEGKPIPDPNNPPITTGSYKMKALSWDSKLEAMSHFDIKAPEKK